MTALIYLCRDNKQEGPYTTDEIQTMLAKGLLDYDILAWREGLREWASLRIVLCIVLSGTPPPLPGQVTMPSTPSEASASRTQEVLPSALPKAAPTSPAHPGIGRLRYFLMQFVIRMGAIFLISLLLDSGHPESGAARALYVWVLAVLFTLILTAQRLRNMGFSPWMALLALIPVVEFVVTIPCLCAPAGYAHTKKLDTTGKIIAAIAIGCLVLSVLAVVLSM